MIASGLPNFIRIVFWIFYNFTFKTSYDNFFNFQNSIRSHVRHRAFATLQIELYRVVDCDIKSHTKSHKACKLEIFVISLLRCLLIYFLILVLCRAHSFYFATLKIELYRVVDY